MKSYKANKDVKVGENLLEKDGQIVTHLHLEKDEILPGHAVDMSVIVVPYKGIIEFTGENGMETIEPGIIIEMEPNETHSLKALEDSQLMVVKAKIK